MRIRMPPAVMLNQQAVNTTSDRSFWRTSDEPTRSTPCEQPSPPIGLAATSCYAENSRNDEDGLNGLSADALSKSRIINADVGVSYQALEQLGVCLTGFRSIAGNSTPSLTGFEFGLSTSMFFGEGV
jgi:hypothetical protein